MVKSTSNGQASKQDKPADKFPLFRHASGRWAKKVKGKLAYFGKIADDPNGQAALELWERQKEDLQAGRKPAPPEKPKASKPKRPSADFPLFQHRNGYWAKKVKGKLAYFGKVADDPQGEAAIAQWIEQKDELLAGRAPRVNRAGLTIAELCNRFLRFKESQLNNEEITARTFAEYRATCDRLYKQFRPAKPVLELAADDFELLRASMAKTWGAVRLGNEITRCRVVFNYAYQNQLIERPIRYGIAFKRPSKKVLRIERAKNGLRMFEAAEIREMIENASPQLKAMILLGINGGLGNNDCGSLPMSAIDLENDWLNYPRPKTGIARRIPLWPETVDALRAVIDSRPKPKNEADSGLVFITKYGQPWAKDTRDNPVTKETVKLLNALGIKRKGLAFYALRHTFETIGGESRDQIAVNAIMGHVDNSMAATYRERIGDERLEAVTNHVRDWLFADAVKKGKRKESGKETAAAGEPSETKTEKPRLRVVG